MCQELREVSEIYTDPTMAQTHSLMKWLFLNVLKEKISITLQNNRLEGPRKTNGLYARTTPLKKWRSGLIKQVNVVRSDLKWSHELFPIFFFKSKAIYFSLFKKRRLDNEMGVWSTDLPFILEMYWEILNPLQKAKYMTFGKSSLLRKFLRKC